MALQSVLKLSLSSLAARNLVQTLSIVPSRSSSFRSSDVFQGAEHHPDVEVIKNPPEWKYVEQLIGSPTIPVPLVKSEYPSGWTPPNPAKYQKLPYFVARSKNFMVPVYLQIKYNGLSRRSILRHVEGDIWKLEKELHSLIESKANRRVFSRINEMNRQIMFKGDYVTLIEKYLISKGL